MTRIKIGLTLFVVAAITIFVTRSFVATDKVAEVQMIGNTTDDVYKIQLEIKNLKQQTENKFYKEYYDAIAYHIYDNHKYSRLGKNKFDNDQWNEILSKQLFAVYTNKFINQTYYVFNHSAWEVSDLRFIRSEYQTLHISPMLEKNSPIDKKFNEIKMIISKYDEVSGFISTCKAFSFLQTDLEISFPHADVRNKISYANSYMNNFVENSYVSNCTRLTNELKEIPQILFRAHVKYLDNLISFWSNRFKDYVTQKAYVNELYTPTLNKINELDNDIYNVSIFTNEYSRLKNRWESDGKSAYDYINSK